MKTLIFLREDKLSPHGGPYGVGYFINEERKKCGDNDIVFLPPDEQSIAKHNKRAKFSKKLPRSVYMFLDSLRRIRRRLKFVKGNTYGPNYDLSKYDIIHFNEAKDLYLQRENLKNYKGIVLFTSHSPIPCFLESMVGIPKLEYKLFHKKYMKSEMVDKFAFERCNYLTFPHPYSEENYITSWDFYKKFREEHKEKYRYILTGIEQRVASKSVSEIRQLSGVKEDDFVVTFAGRHNESKGFGNLLKIGKSMEKDNVQFVICGLQIPLKGLKKPYWHEIGWTSDPYSYINACDVYIQCNTSTYFDLAILEVLSLGKIIIASRTGGNKLFEDMGAKGIFLFDTIEEARELILKIKSMPKKQRDELGELNRQLFLNNFTVKQYYQNYRKLLEDIYQDFHK